MTDNGIPKRIHFVWVGPPMPAWAARNIEEFRRLNPDHEVRVHGEEALHPDYRDIYGRLTEHCEKADLIRYSVLERLGGWYFDTDYWPFRPVADAERAFGLTGGEVLVAEVWPSRANPGWLGNGVIACRPGHPMLVRLRELALAATPDGRLTYGPRLVRTLYEQSPTSFVLAGEPWFNGPKAAHSTKFYRRVVQTGETGFIRRFDPRTGGQLPFAMHLWAWKYAAELDAAGPDPATRDLRPFAVLVTLSDAAPAKTSIFSALATGLDAAGYRVQIVGYDAQAIDRCDAIPDLVVVWNGLRTPGTEIVAEARRYDSRCLYMEHGFWQRSKYSQLDHAGFLHRSSWAAHLREPAPPEGRERLARFYPNGITPMRDRTDGYILVLGQVPNDSQLWDSELQGPLPLQRAVKAALAGSRTPVYFRPHPQCSNVRLPANKIVIPELNHDPAEAVAYRTTKAGLGLADALASARFVITINSTAGNEALAAGVPVLAFGPALYTAAGVAYPTSLKTIKHDIETMLHGWAPSTEAVQNYLEWLAARQWTAEELAEGPALRTILAASGIALPDLPRSHAPMLPCPRAEEAAG